MAIVYIQPGTGTGSGTLEDPYYFDELSAAHTLAGEQGKVIFLDGEYILVDNNTTFKGSTYEAKNRGKAIIKSSSINYLKYIYVGDTSDNYAVSKFKGLSFEDVGSSAWNNRAVNIGSAVDQYHEFESCTFKLYASDYGFLGPGTGSDTPEFSAKFTGCIFDLIRHENGTSDGTAPCFYSASALTNGFELKNCVLKFSSQTDSFLTIVFNDNSGKQEAHIQDTIIFADPGERVNLGTVPHYLTEKNVVYNNISGASTDPAKNVFVDLDPKFIDATNNDYRLRPSSPLIGGFKSSNPAGVYIQPGSATGGSGTFDDPYYMGELGVAETEAAAGEGIIYFVDGEYIVSNLNFHADGITYKSLNKHKAILGKGDAGTTSAVTINVGGAYGTTNLGVGNITLEDFYLKNSRFQLVSNDLSRPNKLTGLKVIDTLPVTHATDGIIWSSSSACIIKSCLFYTDFGAEPTHYFGRGLSNIEVYDSTMIIKFSNASGHINFTPFKSFENSIVYGTTAGIPESGFPAFTAASKDCCFHNIGSNSTYGGENTYQGDPKFVDASSKDFRLRADSPLIGGVNKPKYPMDSVWVQSGTGSGTGTEDDPFYWDEYSDAFLAAAQTTSKQVIFKDGEYLWTSTILQDDNVGNSITMVAENMRQAIFYDNGRISSSGKDPTLRFTGIQLKARDHFTWEQECHYVLESCHFLIQKYIGALSVTAKGCIFEVAPGYNMSIFSHTGPVQIENCIFADHNDFTANDTYLTGATSGTLKNCIFYSKSGRDTALASYAGASLVSCATVNFANPEDGVEFIDNVQFIDIENKNYNLRPSSPLIGQGK